VHALEHDMRSASAWFDMRWTRECYKFLQRMGDLGRGVWSMVWRRRRQRGCDAGDAGDLGDGAGAMVVVQTTPQEDVHAIYARYLLGQATLSDDDDDEFRFEEVDDISGSESESNGEDEEGSDEDEGEDADVSAPELYADLARRSLPPRSRYNTRSPSPHASTSSALTPMFIAHLTSPARAAPLTRHKYTQISQPEPDMAWLTHLHQTRNGTGGNGNGQGAIGSGDDDPRRNCVVCTVEARAVICWPCRCLALCDDCRSNLASRMGAGKHQCPCCRRR
jgi:hypothetical protein